MPNGTYRSAAEWREIKVFFEQLSDPLTKFAKRYNLVIDKYYHDGADWTFRFSHPLSGSGQIQVMMTDSNSVWLACSWHKDDYDACTRSLKYETWKDIPVQPEQLTAKLEKALKLILGWKFGEWTEVVRGYENPWRRYTKEEFEQMEPKYPLPRVYEDS